MAISKMKGRNSDYCDSWYDQEYKKDLMKDFCEECGIKKKYKKIKACDGKVYNHHNLVLHHKDDNKKNSHPDNIMTLCRSCHPKKHGDIKYDYLECWQ